MEMGSGGGGSCRRAPRKSPMGGQNPAGGWLMVNYFGLLAQLCMALSWPGPPRNRRVRGAAEKVAGGPWHAGGNIGRPASVFLVARQRFGDGDERDTEAHQKHLRQAHTRVAAA